MAFVGTKGAALSAIPLAAPALVGSGAGFMLGTQLGNIHNADNKLLSDSFANWDGKNSLLNYGDTSWIDNKITTGPKSLEEMAENAKKFKNEVKETKEIVGVEGVKILTDDEKKKLKEVGDLLEKFRTLNSDVNNKAIAFNMTELEKAEEKLKSLESILSEALDMKLDKKTLSPIVEQYQEAKKYVDQLKTEMDAKKIKENFEKEFKDMNLEFEIFGTEEEERLLQTIRVLENQVSKAISEGMLGNAREFGAELKVVKEQYKEKYELPKKAQKNLDDSMKTLSTSIYQIADVVGGKFLETVSTMINGIDVIRKSLEVLGTGGSGGDITGGFGSIFGNMGSFLGSESSKLMFDKIGASL
ncbi:MAG: hypothetical protein ACRC2Q_08255, partial [Cetobacterium sp.]